MISPKISRFTKDFRMTYKKILSKPLNISGNQKFWIYFSKSQNSMKKYKNLVFSIYKRKPEIFSRFQKSYLEYCVGILNMRKIRFQIFCSYFMEKGSLLRGATLNILRPCPKTEPSLYLREWTMF